MRNRTVQIIAIAGAAVVVLAGCIVGGLALRDFWKSPLGPSIDMATHTPSPVTETEPFMPATDTATASEMPPTATYTYTPTPEPLCGGPRTLLLLVIGSDSRSTDPKEAYRYGLADSIRVVRVDFVEGKVSAVTIPRDLYVAIPWIEDRVGRGTFKVNQAYFYGNPGMRYYNGPGLGPGLLARTLEHNFGIVVENYVAVSMQMFVKMVNAVGGVYVEVPYKMDDRKSRRDPPTMKAGYFLPGIHLMTGAEAMRYARIRYIDNERARQERQNQVAMAVWDRVTSPEIVGQIPGLIDAFTESIRTDLSPEQLSQLACLSTELDQEDITFYKVPGKLLNPGWYKGMYGYWTDYEALGKLLQDFAGGEWTWEGDVDSTPSPVPSEQAPAP